MYYIRSAKELEKIVRFEVSRPKDYRNHFYPCYIEYDDESWDSRSCGYYYFVGDTPAEVMIMRKEELENQLFNLEKERQKIKRELKKLKEISK